MGVNCIKRLRKLAHIKCIHKRKFRVTTDSKHKLPVAPNLLNPQFTQSAPNKVWVADISYIPTDEVWLHLAAVKDLHTCEIVGWYMDERMTFEYIEVFYSRIRRHAKINNQIPAEFAKTCMEKLEKNAA